MSQAAVDAVTELSGRFLAVANSLTPEELAMPSACAGWTVQDLIAHASSNFQAVVEPPAASQEGADGPAPRAEDLMSQLVDARRGWTSEQVLGELNEYAPGWLQALQGLQSEPTASVEVPMSELGTYALASLADAFAFDVACHLYVDLLAPTGPVVRDVPPLDDATLAPGIGWMLTGLPQMCPAVTPVLERPLGLVLTGPGVGEWTLVPDPVRLVVVAGLTDDTAAVVESDAFEFMQWGTFRKPWREQVTISGDHEYAARVLDTINII